MKLSLRGFLSEQLASVPPVVKDDLDGKVVIVTGANNGIGFEAAKHFARMNPKKLIMACRNKEKGAVALSQLKEETKCETAELWLLDLANFASVKAFVERFEKEGGGRLDILVENAGVIPLPKFEPTVDGWESTLQVNYLSNSLLAILLLPRMLETARSHHTLPRLVVVSSEVHFGAKIEQKVLDSPHPLQLFGSREYMNSSAITVARYQDTKLLNVFFTVALAKRLASQPIIVNTTNPGFCTSGLVGNVSGWRAGMFWLMNLFLARTAEEGSRQLVWAAIGGKDKEEALRGAYISLARVSEASDDVISEEGIKLQDRLWDDLIEELSKVEPKVLAIVEKYLT